MGFFNDLKNTVTDAGKDISDRTKTAADNAKIKSQIKDNEKAIEGLVLKVGYRYLEKCTDEVDPEYADLILEIRRIQGETNGLKNALAANSAPAGSRQCTNCGQYNAPEAKFCVACGAELKMPEPAKEEAPAPEKFCPACGGANSADAAFCVNCGKPLS